MSQLCRDNLSKEVANNHYNFICSYIEECGGHVVSHEEKIHYLCLVNRWPEPSPHDVRAIFTVYKNIYGKASNRLEDATKTYWEKQGMLEEV